MSSTYLAKATDENVEHGNAVTTSLPTDDAKILERGELGSVTSERYNNRFSRIHYMKATPWEDTYWDDLRVSVNTVRVQGSTNIPAWGAFKTNCQLLWFDQTVMEQVYFAIQLPHGYKHGTDLNPHVHWVPAANGSADQVVSWGLDYSLAAIGTTFPDVTTIYGNTHVPSADTTLVADRQYLTPLTHISGSSIDSVSTMIVCRLFRDATGGGLTDDYGNDVGLLEIDFHYQIDAPGSDLEYTK